MPAINSGKKNIIACSFLPAATKMIYDMALQEHLHGVTFECPADPLDNKPKVVRCVLEGNDYSSAEIDRIFSASKAQGKSLYYTDEALLQQIQPDIIFTQDVCEVCQIDSACTSSAIALLKKQPAIISLTPQNLSDVYQTAITIAAALGKEEAAYKYLSGLQKKTDAVLDILRHNKMPLKRVMLMEWIDSVYNCGHWIPFQVAQAGGIDMLGNPSGDSIVTSWEKILKYNPEVIVVAPCGFHIKRALKEIKLLTQKAGWNELNAVVNKQVFIVDFDLFTQPAASGMVDGIEMLAALFHPELFLIPQHLQHKTINVFNREEVLAFT